MDAVLSICPCLSALTPAAAALQSYSVTKAVSDSYKYIPKHGVTITWNWKCSTFGDLQRVSNCKLGSHSENGFDFD